MLGSASRPRSALGAATAHLAVILMENKEYAQVVGNTAAAPYINGTLIPHGRLFKTYYATMHPSLPNYLVLTSGRFGACVDDACTPGSDNAENLFHQLNGAGVSWKAYEESMPSNCSATNAAPYAVRHNPAAYYSDLGAAGDGTCAQKDVPFTQLAADLTANALPQFIWITPDLYDDMHSDRKAPPCQLATSSDDEICQGDRWLQTNSSVQGLLARGDVTVVIVFDEGTTGQGGGGHVVLLELG